MISPASAAPENNLPSEIRSRWPEWTVLGLYVALVSFAIPFHEPWADEAQAWQLARSLSLHDLFQTYIRYEGSPGLWHFLLWIMVRMHVSYTGMHWLSGGIAVAGIAILLFRSPFPRIIKLLLPFTYFLLFQYAVVARNYVLAPLLLFMVASCWKKRPIVMALLLGLLANLALHTAVISGGLAIVYFADQILGRDREQGHAWRELYVSATILLCFYAFALWTAWPPHDLLFSRVRGQSRSFLEYAIASLVWGICQPWILSVPFWIIIGVWFRKRQKLLFLLPVLFFVIFSGAVYVNLWHAGLLVPALICLLWITWPKSAEIRAKNEVMGIAAVLVMAVTQILWSANAIYYDHVRAYSPDLAAAKFLKPFVHEGARIAVTYPDKDPNGNQAFAAVGILPYFNRNIYVNQPDSFWSWSDNNPTECRFASALRTHPQIIVAEVQLRDPSVPIDISDAKFKLIEDHGYHLTRTFCGTFPERLQLGQTMCHLMFQPVGEQYQTSANATQASAHSKPTTKFATVATDQSTVAPERASEAKQ